MNEFDDEAGGATDAGATGATGATGAIGRLAAEVRTALVFLTRLPVGGSPLPEGGLAAAARGFAPAGLAVGLLAGAVLVIADGLGLPAPLQAMLALGAVVLLTGALHEDGLADVADGFGGDSAARRLEIMRDSRTGAYGVLALVFSVGLRVFALAALVAAAGPWTAAGALAGAAAASRGMLPWLMMSHGPARADGLAAAAGQPVRDDALVAGATGLLLVLLFLGPWPGLPAAAAGALAAIGAGWWLARQTGGITGDILGAAQQAAEVAVLLVAAAVLA